MQAANRGVAAPAPPLLIGAENSSRRFCMSCMLCERVCSTSWKSRAAPRRSAQRRARIAIDAIRRGSVSASSRSRAAGAVRGARLTCADPECHRRGRESANEKRKNSAPNSHQSRARQFDVFQDASPIATCLHCHDFVYLRRIEATCRLHTAARATAGRCKLALSVSTLPPRVSSQTPRAPPPPPPPPTPRPSARAPLDPCRLRQRGRPTPETATRATPRPTTSSARA